MVLRFHELGGLVEVLAETLLHEVPQRVVQLRRVDDQRAGLEETAERGLELGTGKALDGLAEMALGARPDHLVDHVENAKGHADGFDRTYC